MTAGVWYTLMYMLENHMPPPSWLEPKCPCWHSWTFPVVHVA